MPGGGYNFYWNATNTASSTVPIAVLMGSASGRTYLYDLVSASDATPADNAAKFQIQRSSTAISGLGGTSVTPALIDPANAAANATAMQACTSGPTLTANAFPFQWAQNQRATFRWVAKDGREIVIPATANAGLACISATAATAVNYVQTWEFLE